MTTMQSVESNALIVITRTGEMKRLLRVVHGDVSPCVVVLIEVLNGQDKSFEPLARSWWLSAKVIVRMHETSARYAVAMKKTTLPSRLEMMEMAFAALLFDAQLILHKTHQSADG